MSTQTSAESAPLCICYFGTYRAEYSRNRIMIEGLRRNGVEVIECHEQLWHGIEDRVQAVGGGWASLQFIWRVIVAYVSLLSRFWAIRHDFDLLVVGYPGQFDIYLAWLLGKWRRKPVVWDVFMSIYLIALERGLDRHRFAFNALRAVEKLACHLPDRLILDTADYVEWFNQVHGVAPSRFRLVPTGADSAVFRPLPPASGQTFRAVYYGTYIPNHDPLTIVEAARLLADYPNIEIEMIGDGPERSRCQERATAYGLADLVFTEWLSQDVLIEHVAQAHVCLGAFGQTPQSLMTVQNKIYEGMAMQRAVISGDGPAVRAALCDEEEVLLCARRDPHALATAILRLYFDADRRRRVATAGNRRFQMTYTIEASGSRFKQHLEEAIPSRRTMTSTATPADLIDRHMDPERPLISVVIPNLNYPHIDVTLDALQRQGLPAKLYEVIVVGRDDLGLVRESEIVRRIEMPGRPGAAANRNRGLQEARGDIVCFTDADCVPAADWLVTLLAHFNDENVSVVGGGVVFTPGNYWSLCDHISWFGPFLTNTRAGRRHHLPSLNLSIRRRLYQAVGGFDETFPLAAGEDTEWTARLAQGGVTLWFDPTARVTHAARRFTLGNVWRHSYNYGRYSPKVRSGATEGRHGFYRLLPQRRRPLLVLAPLLATLATINTLRRQPRFGTLYALPGIWLTKLAWGLGAADALAQRGDSSNAGD